MARKTAPKTSPEIGSFALPDPTIKVSNADFVSGALPLSDYKSPSDRLSDDADLAKETLRQVCRDPDAPAAARAQAARTLAEMSGAIGRNARPAPEAGKPVNELTRAELEAELAGI